MRFNRFTQQLFDRILARFAHQGFYEFLRLVTGRTNSLSPSAKKLPRGSTLIRGRNLIVQSEINGGKLLNALASENKFNHLGQFFSPYSFYITIPVEGELNGHLKVTIRTELPAFDEILAVPVELHHIQVHIFHQSEERRQTSKNTPLMTPEKQ